MSRSLHQDSRGIAHVALVVLGVAVLGAVGLVGWRVAQQQKTKTNNSAITTDLAQVISGAKCDYDDKDLCKFFASWKTHKQYRFITTTTGGMDNSSATFEVDNDKSRMAADGYEVISQGRVNYTKDSSDGRWWKQTIPESQDNVSNFSAKPSIDEPSADETKDTTAYKRVGEEACDKLTCLKYQVLNKNEPTAVEFMWFDTKDYQLRRTEKQTNKGLMKATFEYGNVNIVVPTDVKELGPNQYIVPGTTEPQSITTD